MTKTAGYNILRVSLAITFFWIGLLILRDPIFWSGFIDPWMANLIPLEPVNIMYATAVFDIGIGILFLIDVWVPVAALLAAIHLGVILAVAGIDDITVRDIGLLGGSLALLADSMPQKWKVWQKK